MTLPVIEFDKSTDDSCIDLPNKNTSTKPVSIASYPVGRAHDYRMRREIRCLLSILN